MMLETDDGVHDSNEYKIQVVRRANNQMWHYGDKENKDLHELKTIHVSVVLESFTINFYKTTGTFVLSFRLFLGLTVLLLSPGV